MSIPNFTQGFPPDSTTLGQTKSTIRDNLDGTFLAFSVDHRDQNESEPGYHKVIHLVNAPLNANPTPIGGIGQLYVRQVVSSGNVDEALFYESGGGRITMLTTNQGASGNTSLAASTGYTTLPGGLTLQWGFSNSSGGITNVTLPIPFANNFYNAQATMNRNSSNVDTIYAITPPTASFTAAIQFRDTSSGNPFFWTAIGN